MKDETKKKIAERYERELGRGERFWPDSIYKEIEEEGYGMVVTDISIHYRKPAEYDDILKIWVKMIRRTS